MSENVQAQRISFVTLFKILYIGNLIFPTLILIILSVFSFFDFHVLRFGDNYLTGTEGLLKGLITVPFMFLFAFIWSVFFWLSYAVSLWIYSKWRPMKLSYIPAKGTDKDTENE